jgi:hypothetical protein
MNRRGSDEETFDATAAEAPECGGAQNEAGGANRLAAGICHD